VFLSMNSMRTALKTLPSAYDVNTADSLMDRDSW
jgi:hypothetical protein